MRRFAMWMAAASVVAAVIPASAAESRIGEAPFGLAWGPVDQVPSPYKADREANLTVLHYPPGWGPAQGTGTALVVLVVCRDEGLQQVVWVGVPLTGEAHARARRAIRNEGVRRYGEPDPGPVPDSEVWSAGQAILASRVNPDGERELVMTAHGPGYASCSMTHRSASGHWAGAHVADLIGGDAP